MKTTISITLDKGLINQLEKIAKIEDRSVSSLVRLAGRSYLARFNKPASDNPTKPTRKALK